MAKVTAPLFSLKASGAIAKTLVFSNWKGIEDVRQYVIPANPKTAGQLQQRGYLKDAVTQWHTAGFKAQDITAWNLLALALKAPASGYNMFTRYYITALIASKTWTPITNILITNIQKTSATVTADITTDKTGKLYIGTSKTNMIKEVSGTHGSGKYSFSLTALTGSTTYYFYIENTASGEAARTGIYQFTTAAS